MPQHEDNRAARFAEHGKALRDELPADAFLLHPRIDAHGSKARTAQPAAHAERIEEYMADNAALHLGHELDDDVAIGFELADDARFVFLAEGADIELLNGRLVGLKCDADDGLFHHCFPADTSWAPFAMRAPRWNSPAVTFPLPAR